ASAYGNGTDPVTIYLDAGSYSWTGTLNLDVNKSLRLIGAASPDARASGKSLVSGGWKVRMIAVGATDRVYRISGLDLSNVSTGYWIWLYPSNSSGLTVSRLRIDHNTFAGLNAHGALMQLGLKSSPHPTEVQGVIDHNKFLSHANSRIIVYDAGGEDWLTGRAGTAQNLFVEDNLFSNATMDNDGRGCLDMNFGAAMVVRFNESSNCRYLAHGLYNNWNWGTENFELYGNTLTQDSGQRTDGYRAFHHQGTGEWIVFDNTLTATGGRSDQAIQGQHYRDFNASLGLCNGTVPVDGNRVGQNGYPCYHQPGRDGNGALKPWYLWNNRWNTGEKMPFSLYVNGPAHVAADRDFYDETATGPQTSFSSPFDGSTGTGWGTLANRPTACTPTSEVLDSGNGGVAYFATDQGALGTLYRCSAANTWTPHYAPYTYPHPLVDGRGRDNRISPPANLRVGVVQ
ncbi:MAG: hypothetical protein ACR2RL_02175, partial [Gammaproteobacteria bacterium]